MQWAELTKERKYLLILFAAVLFIRLFILVTAWDEPVNSDGVQFISSARAMAKGDVDQALQIYSAPAYPFLLMVFHKVFHHWLFAARMLQNLSLGLCVVFMYLITRRLFDPDAAFWACLAFSLSPFFNRMGIEIYRGPVYVMLVLAAVWTLMQAVGSGRLKWKVTAGLTALLPMLFRIEGVLMMPLAAAVLFWERFRGRVNRRRLVTYALGAFGAALLTFGAIYLLADSALLRHSRLQELVDQAERFVNLRFLESYRTVYEQIDGLEELSPWAQMDQNFAEIARHYLWLVYLIGLVETYIRTIYPLFVIPLFFGLRTKSDRFSTYLWGLQMAFFLVVYTHLIEHDFTGRRFVLAPVALLYPWIGAGFTKIMQVVLKWVKDHRLVVGLAVLMVLSPSGKIWYQVTKYDHTSTRAGRWLASSEYQAAPIIGNDRNFALAADLSMYGPDAQYFHFNPPDRDYSDIEAHALDHHKELIMFKMSHHKKHRIPSLKHYRLIKEFKGPKKSILIYRFIH